jgi:hypothetical protein
MWVYYVKTANMLPVHSVGRGYSRPQTPHLLVLYSVGLSHHLLHTAMHINTGDFRGHLTWPGHWGSTHATCRYRPTEKEELRMHTYKA